MPATTVHPAHNFVRKSSDGRWVPLKAKDDGTIYVETGTAAGPTDLIPIVADVSASGDTTIDAAPGAGFAIEFEWVTAITDPDASTNPRIIIKSSGGTEYYRVFAVAHRETFRLPENQALVVNLNTAVSASTPVAVTVHRRIVSV